MTLPELLASLGTTADEVAATLLAGGFRGVPGSACWCPIARYLRDEGYSYISVDTNEILVSITDVCRTPRVISDFIDRLDNEGAYPELAEPGAEE